MKSDNTCILPGCLYDTLVCGMFNHLVYHQRPHHGLKHSTATEIFQGWLKQNKNVKDNKITSHSLNCQEKQINKILAHTEEDFTYEAKGRYS